MLDKSHWVVLLIIMLENDKQLMTVKMIKRYISEREGVAVEDIEGNGRTQGFARARYKAVRLCYEQTDLSTINIAKQFNQQEALVRVVIRRGYFRDCCTSGFVEWKRTWTGIKIFKEIISKHFNDCTFNGQALINKSIEEGLLCCGEVMNDNHSRQTLYALKDTGFIKQAPDRGWYTLNG